MHVVLLNQAFHPDVVATAQMSKDLADELVRRGHKVTAVASRSIYGKSGAVLPKRETVDGIDVRRVGFSLFGKSGYAARIADFAFFYLLAGLRVVTLPKPDVVVSFTTPPFIAGVGLAARLLRGARAVYWVMDLYPDLPVACGVMKERSLSTRFFEGVNRFLLRRSDVDVVLGRCMRERVIGKGVPEAKVRMVPVWADVGAIAPKRVEESGYRKAWGVGADELVVMYSGNFGIGHDSDTVCAAMEMLRDEPRVRFDFVGGGKRRAKVEAFISEKGLKNAHWHDYQARERLGDLFAAADVHLISLREGVEGIMVPSKLYGILAAGRPSIFVGHPTSEISRVLTETGSGVVVREGDAAGLAAAIRRMAEARREREEMGWRARRAIEGRYDRATLTGAWCELLEQVCGVGREATKGGRASGAMVKEDAAA